MNTVTLPSLSADGYVIDPRIIMVKLFLFYLTMDKRPSSLFYADIHSFKHDLLNNENNPTQKIHAIKESLMALYSRYFTDVQVGILLDPDKSTESRHAFKISIEAKDSKGRQMILRREFETLHSGQVEDLDNIVLGFKATYVEGVDRGEE